MVKITPRERPEVSTKSTPPPYLQGVANVGRKADRTDYFMLFRAAPRQLSQSLIHQVNRRHENLVELFDELNLTGNKLPDLRLRIGTDLCVGQLPALAVPRGDSSAGRAILRI